MSELEELIQQYCPDGVEYYPIHEIFEMRNGYTPSTSNDDFWNGGDIPWFKMEDLRAQGKILSGSCMHITPKAVKGKGLFKANSIIVATSATIGEHALVLVEHLSNQRFTNLYPFQKFEGKVNMFFMNYYFDIVDEWCKTHTNQSSFASVDMEQFRNYSVPVPPLPVQEEIVRILDTFTELQAELQAELQKRLQQYNYYRENLLLNLTPEQGAKEYTLEDITKDIFSGATPSKEKKEYWENGTIPWMSSGEVNLGQVYEVEGRITQLGYDKCSTKMVPEGSVVIALAGQGKTRGTVAILRTSLCTNQSLAALVPNTEMVSGEYLFHYLKTQYIKLREVSAGDGTRGGLNLKMLRNYQVVIPSKDVQTKIVEILNRFETLTNDLTAGLPAEIEKRKQQYEYYRDKLLTFKRAE